jgi:hypothetical protein
MASSFALMLGPASAALPRAKRRQTHRALFVVRRRGDFTSWERIEDNCDKPRKKSLYV